MCCLLACLLFYANRVSRSRSSSSSKSRRGTSIVARANPTILLLTSILLLRKSHNPSATPTSQKSHAARLKLPRPTHAASLCQYPMLVEDGTSAWPNHLVYAKDDSPFLLLSVIFFLGPSSNHPHKTQLSRNERKSDQGPNSDVTSTNANPSSQRKLSQTIAISNSHQLRNLSRYRSQRVVLSGTENPRSRSSIGKQTSTRYKRTDRARGVDGSPLYYLSTDSLAPPILNLQKFFPKLLGV